MSSHLLDLTSEQAAALAHQGQSLSLSAGAGCGKTFVLTERFISFIDPQGLTPTEDLTEIVAITFTEAAAREMRDRIRRRCQDRLNTTSEPAEKAVWRRLIRSLEKARISTIHSFCTSLLRRFAAEAKVDPRFEVLDGPSADLLRVQTLDARMRQLLLDKDQRVIELATLFDLKNLRNFVGGLLAKSDGLFFEKWSGVDVEQLKKTWTKYYDEHYLPGLLEEFSLSEQVLKMFTFCSSVEVDNPKLRAHLQEIQSSIERVNECGDIPTALVQLRSLAKTQGVTTKKDWDSEQDFVSYRDICKDFRAYIDKSPLREIFRDVEIQSAASTGIDLFLLVTDIRNEFERVKFERNCLEFDDLLSRTFRLLTSTEFADVSKSVRNTMRVLMVDEFQDTDSQQVEIVTALCNQKSIGQSLFVVGDFKQSIYRFRGAEPHVSQKLQASLPKENRLSLTVNFRSQPAILEFVNAVFCDAFGEDYEPLRAFREQQTSTPCVEFLWADGSVTDQGEVFKPQFSPAQAARFKEADFIARRIAELIDSEQKIVVDQQTKESRALELGDIAILLRSLSDVHFYETALRDYQLDYYLAGGHAFYAQQEIYDLLHLLRAINSSADELSLAGALRSPFFSIEDEILFWVVEVHGTLNEGITHSRQIPQLTVEQRSKLERAAGTLRYLRSLKDFMLVSELLSKSIEKTGYDAVLMSEFLGERKLANVEKLIEQARSFDRQNPGDLDGFITQLSEFVVRAPKEALAASTTQGDVIRIMTIHHAKGLEFPFVIVPDLNRLPPRISRTPVFDVELGPLVPPMQDDSKTRYCVGWNMYQHAEEKEEAEERKRLLYVACTRASDYLMLSSSFKDIQKEIDKPRSDWLKFLSERFELKTGICRAILPSGYGIPQIRVTLNKPETDRKVSGPSRSVDLINLVNKAKNLQTNKESIPESVLPLSLDISERHHFSFSRISGQLQQGVTSPDSADESFSEIQDLDPKGLGTLVHAVLERVNFHDTNDIRGLCDFLSPVHMDSHWNEAAIAASEMINRFLKTKRANALANATSVHREVEFLLPWKRCGGDFEGHYLHGYIDCLYRDKDGRWHILDYKSNKVSSSRVPQAARSYELQMYVYSLACERAMNVAPIESVLSFLRPSTEFVFERDMSRDRECDTMIDEALESLLNSKNRNF